MTLKNFSTIINGRLIMWGARTYVMGILNITPDSFSGDGLYISREDYVRRAKDQAEQFINAGVDIIDIGGESTRPGAKMIGAEEELQRVIPIIEAVSNLGVMVSVDTYKAEVGEEALRAGAHIINDVWGFKVDPDLAIVAARHNAPVILMHNRSSWAHAEIKDKLGGRYVGIPYDNLIEDINRELMESVEIAHQAGVKDEKIILDPGIGFGKSTEQNLEIVNRLGEFRALGYPILLGPSRKSFIGYTLDLPPDQRIEGTAAAVAIGIDRGADIIRVHDVQAMVRVAKMTDAIVRAKRS